MGTRSFNAAATKQYIEFLQKRMASKNWQETATLEEQTKTALAYERAKTQLKLLGGKNERR